jgi:hypothetical protein
VHITKGTVTGDFLSEVCLSQPANFNQLLDCRELSANDACTTKAQIAHKGYLEYVQGGGFLRTGLIRAGRARCSPVRRIVSINPTNREQKIRDENTYRLD